MSGRSAVARAKRRGPESEAESGRHTRSNNISQQIKILPQQAFHHDDLESLSGSSQREQSVLDSAGYYGYRPPPQHYVAHPQYYQPFPRKKPGPIVLSSAIEKSDFRNHIDGLSDNFRGSLGRLVSFGKQKNKLNGPSGKQNGSYSASGYSRPTPPITAVPSLIHSTTSDPTGGRSVYSGRLPHQQTARRTGPLARRTSQMSHGSRPDIQIFSKGEERSWRAMPNRPEPFSDDVDTIVLLYAPNQASRPLASFYCSSQVLQNVGASKFLGRLDNRQSSRPSQLANRQFDEDIVTSDTFSDNGLDTRATPSISAPLSDYITNIDMVEYYQDHPEQRRLLGASNIKYELFIDNPDLNEQGEDAISWLLTTRNYFALIHNHDALVGVSLFDALSTLTARLFNSVGYVSESTDKKEMIIDFLKRHKYDDVRNNFPHAASMLAFSELPQIQWREGFIEFFAHCTGMRHLGVYQTPEWHSITPCTQILIHSNSADMTRRFRMAQKFFSELDFDDLWPGSIPAKSCGRASFERFRQWIFDYIMERDPSLEHSMSDGGLWLTPDCLEMLKAIFHSLFDYLVDRDILFDGTGCRPGQMWNITRRSGQHFHPDPSAELPMTTILNTFDANHNFPHMPHPYPLLPPSSRPAPRSKLLSKRAPTELEERQADKAAASYLDATNIKALAGQSKLDSVIADFDQFEQTDQIRSIDPRDARLGRWVLIYGALQVLATVETFTPGVKFTCDVQYHLNTMLKGIVPWAKPDAEPELEPHHEMSHAFTAPKRWIRAAPRARVNSHKPILWNEYGDGRERVIVAENDSRPATQHAEGSARHDDLSPSPSLPSLRRNTSVLDKTGAIPRGPGGRGGLTGNLPALEDSVAQSRKAADARVKAKAKVHGFSNYQPPPGW